MALVSFPLSSANHCVLTLTSQAAGHRQVKRLNFVKLFSESVLKPANLLFCFTELKLSVVSSSSSSSSFLLFFLLVFISFYDFFNFLIFSSSVSVSFWSGFAHLSFVSISSSG